MNFNNVTKKPLVLISPLNWGLGHTTRCIPIIRELLELNSSVIVACNRNQKFILEREFQNISFVHLDGYSLRYGKNRLLTLITLVLQSPRLLFAINKEHRWLSRFLINNKIDAIISDNRYGFFSRKVYSVFITHQLQIETGLGRFINRLVQNFLYRWINRFSECWVPDFKGDDNLAGKLSHPVRFPMIPITYIGGLSRLETCNTQPMLHRCLILISGLEPQRAIFESLIMDQIKDFPTGIVLVRGVPATDDELNSSEYVTSLNHVPAHELNRLICASEIIICRSGYSSIMDLLKLKKRCIMIPTPGQPEQEYLAAYLSDKKYIWISHQENFSVSSAIQRASRFSFASFENDMEGYKEEIKKLTLRFSKSSVVG